MRLAKEIPEIKEKLSEGVLNLTNLSMAPGPTSLGAGAATKTPSLEDDASESGEKSVQVDATLFP